MLSADAARVPAAVRSLTHPDAGGHCPYAQVPGFWVRDLFGFARDRYDRLRHLAQGFFPAIIAREVLLRGSPLRPGKGLFACRYRKTLSGEEPNFLVRADRPR